MGDKNILNDNNVAEDKTNTIKSFFRKVKSTYFCVLEKMYVLLDSRKPLLVFLAIWSFILNYFLEASLRKNLITGFTAIFTNTFTFFYNTLLIFCIFCVMLFFKRRLFYFVVVTVTALTLAITNYVVLLSRNTPLNAPDFKIIQSAFGIIDIYLSLFERILVVLLIILAVFLLTFAFIKGRKSRRNLYFSSCAYAIIFSVTLAITLIQSSTVTASHFSNLPTAYRDHGFAFSFLCSVVDRGIDKPDNYNDNSVKTIKDSLENENGKDSVPAISDKVKDEFGTTSEIEGAKVATPSEETPNIIFLQLESFYDLTNVEGLSFNQDPMPIFRELTQKYPHGKLTVPSIGAGTANTEFEVLTGMNIDYFGVAEYPYLSVLQNNTCESIAYNFKDYGYAAHAMHNHTGSFYDRNVVFANLGFDTYISIENMCPIVKNETGWAKDVMLVSELSDVLSYTKDQADVVYAISVQGHGKYPPTPEAYSEIYNEEHPANIIVTGNEADVQKPGVDYWVNQVNDMDAFIGLLINEFQALDEPTVIIMYGDHLPAFELETWSLKEGNLYQTDYVVWNNFEDRGNAEIDLYSYELSSYIMGMYGIDSGYINKLHREYFGTGTDYSEMLHLIQYDMLYGDKFIHNKTSYIPTNIKYGYKETKAIMYKLIGNNLYVYGERFNEKSKIHINGNRKHTTFINNNCVFTSNVKLNPQDEIKVVQETTDHINLRETNKLIFE